MDKIDLEQKIKDAVEARGGRMYENSVGAAPGFPGHVVILPGGRVGFVEIGNPKRGQLIALRKQILDLRTLGCAAMAVNSESQINRMVTYILSDAGKDPAWNAHQDCRAGTIK